MRRGISTPHRASPLQEISRAQRDPKVMTKELKDGKDDVKFCIGICQRKLEGRRHFIHEQPEKSKLIELLMHPEIGSVVLHMCAVGRVAEDEKGEALVKNGNRLMSSWGEVLKCVDRRCLNEVGQDPH